MLHLLMCCAYVCDASVCDCWHDSIDDVCYQAVFPSRRSPSGVSDGAGAWRSNLLPPKLPSGSSKGRVGSQLSSNEAT